MTVKEQVLLLRVTKYGEADLIVNGLTRTGKSITFIAKSALKSKKRFGGGVLEPTHYIRATYQEPKSEKMAVLLEAELLEGFVGLRQSYDRLELALYFLQIVEKVCRDGQTEAKELFELLGHALRAAEKGQRLTELKTVFEIKFLDQQGVLPHEPEFQLAIEHSVRDLSNLHYKSTPISKQRLRDMLDGYVG